MVDFTSDRMVNSLTAWDARHATRRQQDMQAWQDTETRRRYDESTRLARESAGLEAQLQQQQAGLFEQSDLTGLVRNPSTPTGPMQLTPQTAPTAGVEAPTQAAPIVRSTPQANVRQVGALNDATLGVVMEPPTALQESDFNISNVSQRSAFSRYMNRFNETVNNQTTSLEPLARALDGMVRTGLMTQQYANRELTRASQYSGLIDRQRNVVRNVTGARAEEVNAGIRAANPGVDFSGTEYAAPNSAREANNVPEANVGLDIQGGAGTTQELEAELTQNFQGINDTTRPLQPTREMRIAAANIASDRARAALYARHGRADLAAEAFARSLQSQANLITAERQVLYRAAGNGSVGAMQRLMEVYNGYPQGTVRMELTGPNNSMINISYQMEDGSWVPHGQPLPRERVLGSLLNLVDAEGAAARSEANQEYMIAAMNNQADLAEAGIVAQTAQLRMFTDLQIAQMNNDMRRAIAEGQATVVNNDETGTTRIFYPRFNNGRTTWEMEEITTETQRSPDTQGEREVQVPVRRRVTGNVGAN